jgi:nitric oxide reductase NorE protein
MMTDTTQSARAVGRQRTAHLPGDGSMWVFVLGDLVIFGAFFIIFMVYRTQEHRLFLESEQHLSLGIGVLNTLVLITSSWFVARGVAAIRAGDHRRAVRLTAGGGVCGVLFILIKCYEWSAKISQGLTLPHNDFFMFYYMLTGVHLFHVALGLVVLAVVIIDVRNPKRRRIAVAEAGATYWHMVDLLWIVLFALLYVMR